MQVTANLNCQLASLRNRTLTVTEVKVIKKGTTKGLSLGLRRMASKKDVEVYCFDDGQMYPKRWFSKK